MVWTPASSAVLDTERLINLASCMTNQANEEANRLLENLINKEVDLPILLLEAFLSNNDYSMYAGALFKASLKQSCDYIMAEGRQDILSHLLTRLAESIDAILSSPYNAQAILASMINAVVQHEGIGFIWPELEQALIKAVARMQEAYLTLISAQNPDVGVVRPFLCISLLIENISEDSAKILKNYTTLSLAIRKLIETVLLSLTTALANCSPIASNFALLDAFSPIFCLYKSFLNESLSESITQGNTLLTQTFTLIGAICPEAITSDSELLQASLKVILRSITITPEAYHQNEDFFINVLFFFTQITREIYQVEKTSANLNYYTEPKLRSENTNVACLIMSIWHEIISTQDFYPFLRKHISQELVMSLLNACLLQEEELLFLQSSSVAAARDIGQISDLLGSWTNRKHALLILDTLCEIQRDCRTTILQGCACMLSSGDLAAIEAAITIISHTSSHFKGNTILSVLSQIKTTVLDAFYASFPDPLLYNESTRTYSLNQQFILVLETSYRSFTIPDDYSRFLGPPVKGERAVLFLSLIVSHSVHTLTNYVENFDETTLVGILMVFLKILVFSADIRIRYYVTGGIGTIIDISAVSSYNSSSEQDESTQKDQCVTRLSSNRVIFETILNTVCNILLLDVRSNRVVPVELNFLVDLVISCLMVDSGKEGTSIVAGIAEYDMSALGESSFCTNTVLEALAEVFTTLVPSYLPHVTKAATTLAHTNDSDERICLAFLNMNDAISSLLGDFMRSDVGSQTKQLQQLIETSLLPTYIDSVIRGCLLCAEHIKDAVVWPDIKLIESLISFINDALLTGQKLALMILDYKNQSIVPALIHSTPIFVGTTLQAEMLGLIGEIVHQYPNYVFCRSEYVKALLEDLFENIQSSFEPAVQTNAAWLFGTLVERPELITSIGPQAYMSLYCMETTQTLGPYLKLYPGFPKPPTDLLLDQSASPCQLFPNYASLLCDIIQEERATRDVLINAAVALLKWTRTYLILGCILQMLDYRLLLLVAENLDALSLQACQNDDVDERDICFITIFMVVLCMPDVATRSSAEVCSALKRTMNICPITNPEFDSVLDQVLRSNIIVGLNKSTIGDSS